MRALLFRSKDEPLQLHNRETPVPGKGELLIKLQYAALNHRDLWMWKEQELEKSVIPGSDGSGIVEAAGPGASNLLVGKEVIINPGLYWGGDEKTFNDHFEILGNPSEGTFADYITIAEEYVYEKPAHLSMEAAAAIPLAALTAYRAVFTKARVTALDRVLITGIGGGAALFLLQMSLAAGAKVYVTSSVEDKMEKAIELGATAGFNYREKNWVSSAKEVAGGFDVIIDSAGGNGFAALTEVANPCARIVVFGRTAGDINNLKPGIIYNKQLEIYGTVMGSQSEFSKMLTLYSQYKLQPVIDSIFPIADFQEAINRMESGDQFGKILLKL